MAQLTITVPDEIAPRVLDGFSYGHGYQDEVFSDPGDQNSPLIPNPETKLEFSKRTLRNHIKKVVVRYESKIAREEAQQAANDAANADINLT